MTAPTFSDGRDTNHQPRETRRLTYFYHEGVDSSGQHALKFSDGVLLLSDSRLLFLASKLDMLEGSTAETVIAFESAELTTLRRLAPVLVKGTVLPDTCAWNLLLRRRQVFLSTTGRDADSHHAGIYFCMPFSTVLPWNLIQQQ